MQGIIIVCTGDIWYIYLDMNTQQSLTLCIYTNLWSCVNPNFDIGILPELNR